MPCQPPPQYVLDFGSQGAVEDLSERPNRSVKIWYIALLLHCAGVALDLTSDVEALKGVPVWLGDDVCIAEGAGGAGEVLVCAAALHDKSSRRDFNIGRVASSTYST